MRNSKPFRKVMPDLLALGVAFTLIGLSLAPSSMISFAWLSGVGGDKLAHFASYALIGFLALYRRQKLSTSLLLAAVIVYAGGAIELIQAEFGRTPDLADFVANCLGVAVGGLAVAAVQLGRSQMGQKSTFHKV